MRHLDEYLRQSCRQSLRRKLTPRRRVDAAPQHPAAELCVIKDSLHQIADRRGFFRIQIAALLADPVISFPSIGTEVICTWVTSRGGPFEDDRFFVRRRRIVHIQIETVDG